MLAFFKNILNNKIGQKRDFQQKYRLVQRKLLQKVVLLTRKIKSKYQQCQQELNVIK